MPCDVCGTQNENDFETISVYPCGHAFNACCTRKFLNFTLNCPICIEPLSICFPVECIKMQCYFLSD